MSSKFIQSAARLLGRLLRDQRGSQLAVIALMIPPIIGISALAVDGGVLAYDHMSLQAAADAAAASAVQRYQQGGASPSTSTLTLEAEAIAAQYGFVNGTSGVTVTVNWPPTGKITSGGSLQSCIDENLSASDQYFGDTSKIEVIVSKPISRYLSTIWSSNQINLCGRAIGSPSGGICILALDSTANGAFTASQNTAITLTGCGLFSNSTSTTDSILVSGTASVQATNGGTIGAAGAVDITTTGIVSPTPVPNLTPVPDPYASVSIPSPGSAITFSAFTYNTPSTVNCGTTTSISSPLTSPFTLTPGTCYTGPGGSNHGLINISTGGCLVAAGVGTYTFKGTGGIQISGTPPSVGPCSGKSINVPSSATINVAGPITVGAFISAQSVNLNPTLNAGGIDVKNNATLTITSNPLIVNGQVTVENGGSLTISANTSVNSGSPNGTAISVLSGGTLVLGSGPYALNGGISSSGTVTLSSLSPSTHCQTLGSGANAVNYDYCMTDVISINGGSFTLNPSNYVLNNNSLSAAAIDVNGTLTLNGTGTYNLNINAPIAAENGSQVTFSSGGNYNLASGLTVDKGTITFGSGSSTFSANGLTQMKGGTLSLSSGTYTFYGGITNTQQGATINITGTSSSPSTVIFSSTSSTGNTLSLHGSGSITANYATLVFTSSSSTNIYPSAPNYSMIDLPNGSSATLSAPTTGSTHGIALLGDRSMPVGTQFYIENGANLVFTGAIYLPKGTLAYQGGGATTTSCSQLVANRFQYTNGTASYANSCFSTGVSQIFIPGQGTLVE